LKFPRKAFLVKQLNIYFVTDTAVHNGAKTCLQTDEVKCSCTMQSAKNYHYFSSVHDMKRLQTVHHSKLFITKNGSDASVVNWSYTDWTDYYESCRMYL